jgi:hypothetical protein
MIGLGRGSAQHPPTAPNRHVFPQGDFGGHGKSQFHDRPFRERRLGVKENSPASQVLSESVHRPSLEVNRQRQVHFETLRAPSLKTMFQTMLKTISICAHRPSLPDPVPGSVISDRCPVHPNSIADRTRREVPNGPCVGFTLQTAKPCTTKPTNYLEVFGSQAFPSCTFGPLVVNGFAIDPRPNAVIPCRDPKDVKKF